MRINGVEIDTSNTVPFNQYMPSEADMSLVMHEDGTTTEEYQPQPQQVITKIAKPKESVAKRLSTSTEPCTVDSNVVGYDPIAKRDIAKYDAEGREFAGFDNKTGDPVYKAEAPVPEEDLGLADYIKATEAKVSEVDAILSQLETERKAKEDKILAEMREEQAIAERVAYEEEELRRLEDACLAQDEAERLEAERLEAERLERERLEAERQAEVERLERERLETERLERERLEAERLERERLELARLEAERQAEIERSERAKQERLRAHTCNGLFAFDGFSAEDICDASYTPPTKAAYYATMLGALVDESIPEVREAAMPTERPFVVGNPIRKPVIPKQPEMRTNKGITEKTPKGITEETPKVLDITKDIEEVAAKAEALEQQSFVKATEETTSPTEAVVQAHQSARQAEFFQEAIQESVGFEIETQLVDFSSEKDMLDDDLDTNYLKKAKKDKISLTKTTKKQKPVKTKAKAEPKVAKPKAETKAEPKVAKPKLFGSQMFKTKAWWKSWGVLTTVSGTVMITVLLFGICTLGNIVTEDLRDKQMADSFNAEMEEYIQNIPIEVPALDEIPEGSELVDTNTGDSFELVENTFNLLAPDWGTIKAQYPNAVAWIRIPGTDIDYAIAQSDDNSYYLTHTIDDKKSKMGWLFLDYRNTTDFLASNIVVYGHNMANGTMFGTIPHMMREPWVNDKNNQYIYFSTETETAVYQIHSIMRVDSDSVKYNQTSISSSEMVDYLAKMRGYNLVKELSYSSDAYEPFDRVITLSTCADAFGTEKLVVQGILIHTQKL